MTPLDQDWRDADRLSRQGRWEEAGARWWALAQRCRAEDLTARGQDAASRATDAFRRDDRPAAAVDALRLAWALGQRSARDLVELSAVLLDAGQAVAAEVAARSAAELAKGPAEGALVLDALFNVLLARGLVAEAAALHARSPRAEDPEQVLAHRFQAARLARLDGLLHAAEASHAAVAERLTPYPAAAAGLAVVYDAQAEVALTRAALARIAGRDPERWLLRAEALLDEGATAWQRARRRAGRHGNEVWRAAHAWLAEGDEALGPIDQALSYAAERGLPTATAEWAGVRAGITGDPVDLSRALAAATECPPARGRARLQWMERVSSDAEGVETQLDLAWLELADDKPATVRLLLIQGQRSGDPTLLGAARHQAAAILDAV